MKPAGLLVALALVAGRALAEPSVPAICTEVLNLANRSELTKAFLDAARDAPDKAPDIFEGGFVSGAPVYLGRVANGRCFVLGCTPAFAYSTDSGGFWLFDEELEIFPHNRLTTFDLDENGEWGAARGILHRQGHDYVVWSDLDRLSYVARIDEGAKETLVCRYARPDPPRPTVVRGDHPVCKAVVEKREITVPFDRPHKLRRTSFDTKRAPPLDVLPLAASVDIDNDGAKDLLARHVYHRSGSDCGNTRLAILTSDFEHIEEGASQAFLDGMPATCSSDAWPIEFGGRAYLKSVTYEPSDAIERVHLIDHGQVHELCRIEMRVTNALVMQ